MLYSNLERLEEEIPPALLEFHNLLSLSEATSPGSFVLLERHPNDGSWHLTLKLKDWPAGRVRAIASIKIVGPEEFWIAAWRLPLTSIFPPRLYVEKGAASALTGVDKLIGLNWK
jgi:hypothetical protein